MFTKLKLYIVLGVIIVGLGIFVSRYLNNHSFVSDKFIAEKDSTLSKKDKEILLLQKQVFSIQQDLDICTKNKTNHEVIADKLTKERNEARTEAKTLREAIEHYEANDLIRYFVFDKKGIFKKGCYEEVFQKPDNICK